MAELKEGLIGGAVNLYFIYKFLRILTTPWEKSEAFKLGIVDDNGKILKKKKTLKTIEEKDAYTMMHRLVWKLKRLMEKVPFGKSRLASYAAALWLIKEGKFQRTDEQLQESFLTFLETDWKNDAQIKERLILNHLIEFYNVYPAHAPTRILFYKIEEHFWPMLKTFLIFLDRMPDKIGLIRGKEIKSTDIILDDGIVTRLRAIKV